MSDPLYTLTPAFDEPEDKTTVLVVYALYLASFFTGGLTAVIGLVMAYVLKDNATSWGMSHYIFQIRTFWAGVVWLFVTLVLMAVGIPLSPFLIGVPLVMAGALAGAIITIWFAVRSIVGLIAAAQDRPYGQPRAWLL